MVRFVVSMVGYDAGIDADLKLSIAIMRRFYVMKTDVGM